MPMGVKSTPSVKNTLSGGEKTSGEVESTTAAERMIPSQERAAAPGVVGNDHTDW